MEKKGFALFATFNIQAFLESWVKFYKDVHGIVVDPGTVLLPPVDLALGAGTVMIPGVAIEKDLAQIKKMTKGNLLHRYTDQAIDGLIQRDKEAARPSSSYAFWTAPAVEAIQQAPHLAGKSYNDVVEMNLLSQIMNYTEYIRFFCWHMWATGQPLDIKNWTLTGSLVADGAVLNGFWVGDGFGVHWCSRGVAVDYIRFRQVVLPPLS